MSKRIYELETEYESSVNARIWEYVKSGAGSGSGLYENRARQDFAHLLVRIDDLKAELAELERKPPEPDYSPYD